MGVLNERQEKHAVWAVRIMRCRLGNPARLRNFIAVNYGVDYTLGQAEIIWKRWRGTPCRSLVPINQRDHSCR